MNLYDSLHRELRRFEPGNPSRVTVYGCGPTVYDYAHIGNFRTFVVYDLLHRHLRRRGHGVEFVVNFTDVDDKTIDGAAAAGRSLSEHTGPFIEAFLEDAETLGFLPVSGHPRATEFIPAMVDFVERLLDAGHAYMAGDGSVYYSVATFGDYGKLSGKGGEHDARRSRIDTGEFAKADPRDFALWKAAQPTDGEVGAVWDSPWGPGRPGWHLECSVMVMSLLGDTVDIHVGGEDLLFPHHENEIAQSEAASGHCFARFWMHVKHLKVDDRKMSKSLGNFHTVRELVRDGHDPAAIRWVLLSAHYRSELNFTTSALADATESVQRLLDFRRRVTEGEAGDVAEREAGGSVARAARSGGDLEERARQHLAAFDAAMDQDLNVPRALASLWGLVRDGNAALDAPGGVSGGDRKAVLAALAEMDRTLGVMDLAARTRDVDDDTSRRIQEMVEARDRARKVRDFATADRLRAELESRGVRLEDTPAGTRWKLVRPPGS